MDALTIKVSHWAKEMVIPETSWKIRGFSRSAYRTGFYIPELNIMLDAGPQNFNKPKHIFITHTHIDHIACLPLTMIGEECGNHIFNIYAPLSSHTYIHNYIKAMFDVNSMGDVNISPWYMFKGLIKHDTVALDANKTKLLVEVFECDHKIPTVSYGFSEIKSKLKDEYKSFSGKRSFN